MGPGLWSHRLPVQGLPRKPAAGEAEATDSLPPGRFRNGRPPGPRAQPEPVQKAAAPRGHRVEFAGRKIIVEQELPKMPARSQDTTGVWCQDVRPCDPEPRTRGALERLADA